MPPFSFPRHLVSPSPSPLARAVPSAAVGLLLPVLVHVFMDSCVRHCTLPCFWGYALSIIPYSLLLPCDGKPGHRLGGWMLLRYECCVAPSLANWVAGGEARCLFSLSECLEPRNGLAQISPVVSPSARHLDSPLSFHHLKTTQN